MCPWCRLAAAVARRPNQARLLQSSRDRPLETALDPPDSPCSVLFRDDVHDDVVGLRIRPKVESRLSRDRSLGPLDPVVRRRSRPGVPTTIDIELEVTSWIFESGHRVRLSLAGSDWPNTWPPPHGGVLEVTRSSVKLELPVLEGPEVAPAPVFEPAPPRDDAPRDKEQPPVVWRIERDVLERETRVVTSYGSTYDAPFDAKITERYDGAVGVSTDEPGNASARAT